MEDLYDALLFYDELPPEQRAAVAERLNSDPSLADAFRQWRAACARVRERFATDLPDCRLLVLYALDADGHGDLLTPQEHDALQAARPDLKAALDQHPALHDVVARIQDERDDFEAVWNEQTASLLEVADAVTPAAAPSDALPDAVDRRAGAERTDRAPRRSSSAETPERRRIGWVTTTALAALVTVLAVFLWPRSPEHTVITTAADDVRTVELVDGSMIRLVGEAQLAYEAPEGEPFDRRVTLRYGRAFFEVQALKSEAPFRVTTPTATATVLGTEFGVDATPDETDVVLTSGSVQVSTPSPSPETTVTLAPGQRSRVPRDGAPSAPVAVDLSETLSWTGFLIFRATPLETIAERLEAQYDVSIAVAPALQQETVTGTFDSGQSVTTVLQTISATLDASLKGTPETGLRIVAE